MTLSIDGALFALQHMKRKPMNKTVLAASTALMMLLCACATAPVAAQEQAAPPVVAAAASTASLTLTIRGVAAGRGPVMVALLGEAGWAGQAEPVRVGQLEASGAEVSVTFNDLPSGTYGVRLYQDLNADGQMGTNPFGIPNEPYAFSNDAPARFGPPDWAEASFTVAAPAAVHVITIPE